jgi:fluoride ion exporter CrcB/FEX
VQRLVPSERPWGTTTVNVAGSFVLGVVAAARHERLVSAGGAPASAAR